MTVFGLGVYYFSEESTSAVYCSFSYSQMHADWENKFGKHLGKKVVLLTGETSADLPLLRTVCDIM